MRTGRSFCTCWEFMGILLPYQKTQNCYVAKRNKENLGPNLYGYKRAFTYTPSEEDRDWVELTVGGALKVLSVLDPTAGGGSIPIETGRLGLTSIANDLNPVAALILRATVDWPVRYGPALSEQFGKLACEFIRRAEPKYESVFPSESEGIRVEGYLWARTITLVPIAQALCRCRRTGVLHLTESASG